MTAATNTHTEQGVAMAWVEAAFAKYGWILIGLSFGFAAKYALLLKRGVVIKPQLVLADVLLLPLVALIAYHIAHQFGASGEAAALLAAFSAVGADRLVKLLTEQFFRRVENDITAVSQRVRGQVRQEVQAELSGQAIIDDTLSGRAPTEYAALRPRPDPDELT